MHQAPLSMEFSRQKYWNGLPLPSPGCLPDPGTDPGSAALQADSVQSEPPGNLYSVLCNFLFYACFFNFFLPVFNYIYSIFLLFLRWLSKVLCKV